MTGKSMPTLTLSADLWSNPGRSLLVGAITLGIPILLAGCQTEPKGGRLVATVEHSRSVSILQTINAAGQRCWFRSKDPAFRDFRLIPELDTTVGNPRLLIVKAAAPTGLPELVIEASGEPVKLATYGPLTKHNLSGRINEDILRWATGNDACTA